MDNKGKYIEVGTPLLCAYPCSEPVMIPPGWPRGWQDNATEGERSSEQRQLQIPVRLIFCDSIVLLQNHNSSHCRVKAVNNEGESEPLTADQYTLIKVCTSCPMEVLFRLL